MKQILFILIIIIVPYRIYGTEDVFRKAVGFALADMAKNHQEYDEAYADFKDDDFDLTQYMQMSRDFFKQSHDTIYIDTEHLTFSEIYLDNTDIKPVTFNLCYTNAVQRDVEGKAKKGIIMYIPHLMFSDNYLSVVVFVELVVYKKESANERYAIYTVPLNRRDYEFEYDCSLNDWIFVESY